MTVEKAPKLKYAFTNIGSFYIIDVDSIVEMSGLDITNKAHYYLINSEITRLIIAGVKSKRYAGIIYINSLMNDEVINGLKDLLSNIVNSNVDTLVLMDDYDAPKLKKYYRMFDEVMFFPTFKKAKIIRCKGKGI